MRIIAGQAAGIRLQAGRGQCLRPTADRVKESLFATLGDLRGWRVADLFAGSGALGLEALSRGAASVDFVESQPQHEGLLRRNLARVLTSVGNPERAGDTAVFRGDAWHPQRILARRTGQLDLILMDPPYAEASDRGALAQWMTDPAVADWAGDALLVLEHPRRASLPWHPLGAWRMLRHKSYGDSAVSFCRTNNDGKG